VAHAGPQPDFIIMDFALPRIDGLEATRRLKADARTRHIPVLLFTAHMGTEMRMRAEEAGCLGVLGKLDGASGLFDAIDRATLPAAAPIPAP
jgi:CheY-like chemotaxis protein